MYFCTSSFHFDCSFSPYSANFFIFFSSSSILESKSSGAIGGLTIILPNLVTTAKSIVNAYAASSLSLFFGFLPLCFLPPPIIRTSSFLESAAKIFPSFSFYSISY
jgi:hypothetical protein